MIRATAILLVTLLHAPIHCAGSGEHLIHQEETAGEALYNLAQSFREKGDTDAWHHTLNVLVERYPSSRFAAAAKADLGEP